MKQQCIVLLHFAQLTLYDGDYSTSYKYASKAQQLSDLSMDLYDSARALHLQAYSSTFLGNYHKSLEKLHAARENLEICGMSGGLLDSYVSLDQAEIHLLKSEYLQAQGIYNDTAEAISPGVHAYAVLNLAYIGIQIGCSATDIYEKINIAARIFKSTQHPNLVQCKIVEACLNLREHTFDLAQREFEKTSHNNLTEIKSACREQLANIKAWQGSQGQSRWPAIYLAFAYKAKEKLALHKALLFLGDVFVINEDEDTACMLYTVALEGFTYMDVHRSQAECMFRLGDLAHKHGDASAAVVHWTAARPLFEKSSQAKDMAIIDSRLASVKKSHGFEALTALAKLQSPTHALNQVAASREQPTKIAQV
ncbi:hypothetical protein C8R45DRAFT_926865 [Mycena sanguinolenta]|nr:hypothetical protein C8R45DRAFT_926865 [Mycena sanguinolenta]